MQFIKSVFIALALFSLR